MELSHKTPENVKMQKTIGAIVVGSSCPREALQHSRPKCANDATHYLLRPHAMTSDDEARPMHGYVGVASPTCTSSETLHHA